MPWSPTPWSETYLRDEEEWRRRAQRRRAGKEDASRERASRERASRERAGRERASREGAGRESVCPLHHLLAACTPRVFAHVLSMVGSMVQTAWRRSALQGGVCLHNVSPASDDLLRPIAVVEINVDDGHLLDARGVGELVAVAGWPVGEGSGGRRAAGRLREETVEEVSKEAAARGIRGRNDTKRVTKRSRRVRGRDAERAQRA